MASKSPAVIGPPPPHPFVSDPGGVFATDAHRRVLGYLPTPDSEATTLALLTKRIADNDKEHAGRMAEEEFAGVLASLEEEGYVDSAHGALKMTAKGFEALQGGN
jgi:hypothetical protein